MLTRNKNTRITLGSSIYMNLVERYCSAVMEETQSGEGKVVTAGS